MRRGVTPCSRKRSSSFISANTSLERTRFFRIKVTPITLDYCLVDLLDREILLLKPLVEVPDQPELDPAVDPRIAVGYQPGCEQVDVPGQWAVP